MFIINDIGKEEYEDMKNTGNMEIIGRQLALIYQRSANFLILLHLAPTECIRRNLFAPILSSPIKQLLSRPRMPRYTLMRINCIFHT